MKIHIISDIHIRSNQDPFLDVLIPHLLTIDKNDKIVLLGDVFEMFVFAKKAFLQKYSRILDVFGKISKRGNEIIFIEGNHEYFMTDVFKSDNIKVYESGKCELEIFGKKIYFAHGDEVLPNDYGYIFLKKLIRNPFTKFIVRLTPGCFLNFMGESLSKESKKHTSVRRISKRNAIIQHFRDFASMKIKSGFDVVVLGHSHIFENIKIGNGIYLNPSDPRKDGKLITISLDGNELLIQEHSLC